MDYLNNVQSGIGGGAIGYATAADAAPHQTFADPLSAAHSNLSDLVARLAAITERLCGSVPEPQQTGEVSQKLAAVPNGIFDELTTRGYDMNRKIERGMNMLSRIERALP